MVTKITIGDGLILTPENGYYLQSISGLGYETKYPVNQILSRHGAKIGNAVYSNKKISIGLEIGGNDFVEILERRNELYKKLSVNQYSSDDKIRFDFTRNDNITVGIEGVISSVDAPLDTNNQFRSPLRISLDTEFPFLTSSQLYSISIPILLGGGAEVPMEVPLDFSAGSSVATTVAQGGNVFSFPTIRFVGPLSEPVLTDVLSDKTLSLAINLDVDEYVEIDTYHETVVDHTGANRLSDISGDFLIVPASTDNKFTLTTENSLETGYVTLTYPYTYVAI